MENNFESALRQAEINKLFIEYSFTMINLLKPAIEQGDGLLIGELEKRIAEFLKKC